MKAVSRIRAFELPQHALLARYTLSRDYTDCFVTEIRGRLAHADFVTAFYCSWLFRLERLLLRLVSRPSTDEEARELAMGARDRFAAWSVEDRAPDQLLLCDYLGSTRSWLMVEPLSLDGAPVTRLYFGSAVMKRANGGSGSRTMGRAFRLLMPFHQLYSRALLAAARSRLVAGKT